MDNAKAEEKRNEPRKKEVGMNINRIIYNNIKNNRSDKSLEDDLLIAYQNKVDIGDINHSSKLVEYMIPFIAADIRESIIEFLSTPLKQTQFLPTGKILADSSTTNHRQREFVGFLTVVPDNEEVLIRTVHLPIIMQKDGKGHSQKEAICKSLKVGTESLIINSDQYLGTSGDGHFQHCHVHELVDDAFGVKRHHEYDPMHKAGRQDIHIRKDKSFQWLTKLTQNISGASKFVNLGKEFQNFFEICEKIIENPNYPESKFYELTFYNECRFANSTARVYKCVYNQYSGLVEALETAIEVRSQKKDKHNQDTARKVSNIANYLHTVRNASRLSGLADLYEVFARGITVLQKINYLPYERMDQYFGIIAQFNTMSKCINNHSLCPPTEDEGNCVWPRLHSQVPDLRQGKFKNKVLAAEIAEENRAGLRSSKTSKNENQVNESIKELKKLSEVMYQKLNDNVYKTDDKAFIEKIRSITDLHALAEMCANKSVERVYLLTVNKFVRNARELTPHGKEIPVITLKEQYKLALQKINEMNSGKEQLYASKKIIMLLIESERKLYEGIEKFIYVVTTAAVLTGIESIIESHISVFNARLKGRNITHERAADEVMIKINGPDISESGKLLERVVEKSKKGWHFVRQQRNVKNWTVSKVIDRKLGQKSSLPFTV